MVRRMEQRHLPDTSEIRLVRADASADDLVVEGGIRHGHPTVNRIAFTDGDRAGHDPSTDGSDPHHLTDGRTAEFARLVAGRHPHCVPPRDGLAGVRERTLCRGGSVAKSPVGDGAAPDGRRTVERLGGTVDPGDPTER